MKFINAFLIVLMTMLLSVNTVYADSDFYYVYDTENSVKETFGSYAEAYEYYIDNKDNFNNLVLSDEHDVLEMEYGVVSFISDGCRLNTEYYSLKRNEKDTFNSCLGNDALYLYSENSKVIFAMANDIGSISKQDVRLIPFDSKITVSSFVYKDSYLYHNIKSQMDRNYYSYSLILDKDLNSLKNNSRYYSYDTHYFYDDFYVMSDDYRNNTRENAVNTDAYYNYYQYLPIRSISAYREDEIESYLNEKLHFIGRLNSYSDLNNDNANDVVNRSQLYGIADTLIANQTVNGTNAMMLLAMAINESDYGKSENSYYYNSLFYTTSFNSGAQRNSGHYEKVSDSVDNLARYTIGRYFANYRSAYYNGLHFGDKNSGLTVNYCVDPYYGEKSASIYFGIDETMGFKDRNAYSLLISEKDPDLYKDYDLNNYLYTYGLNEGSFVVLEENEGVYKIQDDRANGDYSYSFMDNVAYISGNSVFTVLNEKEEYGDERSFERVHIDFDGGTYQGYDEIDFYTVDLYAADSIKPSYDEHEFAGYTKEYDGDNHIWNYIAQYRNIVSVDIEDNIDETIDLNTYIRLNDSHLVVSYDNGKGKLVDLNTDYIGFYENGYIHEETLRLNYNGLRYGKVINVSDEKDILRQKIDEEIENKDYINLKKDVSNNDINLGWNNIRTVDNELFHKNRRNYVMNMYNEDLDVSVSGLDLSLPDRKTFSLIQDIYYAGIDNISDKDQSAIMDTASSYGLISEYGLNLSFRFNYEELSLKGPIVVQSRIADKANDRIYTVYHLRKNGDIVKCKSVFTNNYIIFEADEEGAYLVLSKDSFNIYDNSDTVENLEKADTGIDEHKVNIEFLVVMVLVITNFIGVLVYYIVNSRKEEKWRDYRKSLQTQASVHEGKRKN